MSTTTEPTKLVAFGRFSYLHVNEPTAFKDEDTKKYSVSLLIAKSDKKTIAAIEAAITAAKELGKKKFGWDEKTFKSKNFRTPFADGDIEKPEDEVYAEHMYLVAKSVNQPGLVDKNRQKILDPTEVYSGAFGYISVNFYPYKQGGIACGLNNLMKTKDGERLGGGSSAEEDFAGVDIPEDEEDFL